MFKTRRKPEKKKHTTCWTSEIRSENVMSDLVCIINCPVFYLLGQAPNPQPLTKSGVAAAVGAFTSQVISSKASYDILVYTCHFWSSFFFSTNIFHFDPVCICLYCLSLKAQPLEKPSLLSGPGVVDRNLHPGHVTHAVHRDLRVALLQGLGQGPTWKIVEVDVEVEAPDFFWTKDCVSW